MSFTDKVIIVTGASSGIGADAAKHLAALGGKLSLVGRDETRLNQVAEKIKSSDSLVKPLVIVADVAKDAERIISETVTHFGQLDVLINSAGICILDNAENFNVSAFDKIFDTNIRAVAILTSLAIPHLEKTKGNVVNISSVAGLKVPQGNLGLISYSMSKAALDQFTRCSAKELAPKGIRVNAVNPALIRTPVIGTFTEAEALENMIESSKNWHPIGRIGETTDTSLAIAYVASESSSFITGILLPVDGGYLL